MIEAVEDDKQSQRLDGPESGGLKKMRSTFVQPSFTLDDEPYDSATKARSNSGERKKSCDRE